MVHEYFLVDQVVEDMGYGHYKGFVEDIKKLVKFMHWETDLEMAREVGMNASCQCGWVRIVEILLRSGEVDPSDKNNCSLALAAIYGHADVVKVLLTDPRLKFGPGRNTGLDPARHFKYDEVVKLLECALAI